MSHLFGWIGRPEAAYDIGAACARVSSDSTPGTSHVRVLSGPGWALCTSQTASNATMAHDGNVAATIVGDVRWRDESLAAISRRSGMAATVAEGYRRHGPAVLERMLGSFAVAVLDTTARAAVVAIDRMGIQTLCYAEADGCLVFGSTADLVTAHPGISTQVSPQAIYNYLYCHMVPSPGTIYTGVSKLLPAQCLDWRTGHSNTRFWWSLRYNDGHLDYDEGAAEFRRLLRNAVREHLQDARSAGAFLSGGTDSSTVAGLISELAAPADTYSIGFDATGFDEMEYARITSRHFATRAHEYYLTPQDVVDAIPRIARAYDEPFGNASAVPTYFCALAARRDGKEVMLAGDGGDEIFGGNVRYAKQQVFEWYWSLPQSIRTAILEPLALRSTPGDRIPPLRKLSSYVQQASVRLPDRLETYNFLEREPLENILAPEFTSSIDAAQPREIARDAYARAQSSSAVNRMMHLDLKQTLADNDLRKVSGMCRLAGIEVRYPLLDDHLVEFSGRLPGSFKVRHLKLRWFFKKALSDFLPRETISKTKHGFGLPFGLWLQTHSDLQQLTGDSLMSLRRRGIVRDTYIDRLLTLHGAESATYYGVMIWVLVMLEQWFQAHEA
ncbi:MAG TPA: asparagine synthase-related protein [Burkholderiales bacterium]|nr:asparagine synthase-related protein [Burkholderiales bacterium]